MLKGKRQADFCKSALFHSTWRKFSSVGTKRTFAAENSCIRALMAKCEASASNAWWQIIWLPYIMNAHLWYSKNFSKICGTLSLS